MGNDTKAIAEFGDRLHRAMAHAGLDREVLADVLGYERRSVSLLLLGRAVPSLPQIVALAGQCGVDARWLATGWRDVARGLDVITPAPYLGRGVCRYCGCVDERACPQGCAWADEAHTICTACLQSE